MSVLSVARKDFLDVRRAKIVWFVAGLYTAFAVLLFYFGQQGVPEPDVRSELMALSGLGAMFIPLIALVAAYLAIAGERESGSIKYLLSLPYSRRDVVLGKYLSRAAVVAASILLAFGVGAALTVLWYPDLHAGTFARAVALTLLYALTYVAVAVGISASTASRSRAMGGAIGFFFATNMLVLFGQFSIVGALDYLLNDLLALGVSDEALEFVRSLSPTVAYVDAMPLAFPDAANQRPGVDEVPLYLEPEMMLAILLAWLVVPILFGVWRFQRADLG